MTLLNPSRAMPRKLAAWLMLASALCLLVALCLFFWVSVAPQRVPYLNVQVLPGEITRVQVKPDRALGRPLFWAGRRPQELASLDAQDGNLVVDAEPMTGVRLLGILAKADSYIALLDVDGKVLRVQGGENIQQWTVSRVTESEVHFSSHGETAKLALQRELHQSIKLRI